MQALKSAQMRAGLIDATISVLVRKAYPGTTMPQVVMEAGLSRGAMQHHYYSGTSLIEATIMHLHERGVSAFRQQLSVSLDHAAMVRTYWKQIQKPAFMAFHELAVATRTNADLAAVLIQLQVDFRGRFNQLAAQPYPQWQTSTDRFGRVIAVSQATMEGVASNLLTIAMDTALLEPALSSLDEPIQAPRLANLVQST